jgi:glutamate/tyrosine decarboxylase-like PLP-dependent enzyme
MALDIALACGQIGPRYFGLVTGGVTPASLLGDILVSSYDQNVQIHLPSETISTTLESKTLEMLLDLLGLEKDAFPGRTLTTGATASNVLGLACGREFVMKAIHGETFSIADEGLSGCDCVLLHAHGHASVGKAASLVGLGRKRCVNLAQAHAEPGFDLTLLETKLQEYQAKKVGVILVLSYGEVNTGWYSENVSAIRSLCNEYNAWLHIDAGEKRLIINSAVCG